MGEDTDTEIGLASGDPIFSHTGAFIQAGVGGAVVDIDYDNDGTNEITGITLADGETYYLNQDDSLVVVAEDEL